MLTKLRCTARPTNRGSRLRDSPWLLSQHRWPGAAALIVSWGMKTVAKLTERRQELQSELDVLVDRRSACKTEAERLELIPQAVRIIGEIRRVEDEIWSLTGDTRPPGYKKA